MKELAEQLLTAEEAAGLTGLHAATLRKMAWQRRIRSFKVLGALRFKRSDLEELIVDADRADAAGNSNGYRDEREAITEIDGQLHDEMPEFLRRT